MAEVYVKGLKPLNDFLQTLPVKIERNIMRSALRAGMNVVKPAAQANIHSVSGLLAKGLKVGTNARRGIVTARLRATGPHAHVAKWIEYGVKPHIITAKKGGVLSFGSVFAKSIQHPGFKGTGFMRNALDRQSGRAVVAVGNAVKARLTKEGLNVSHINIEGDE